MRAKTLGLIGYGEVGQALAGRLSADGKIRVKVFDIRFADSTSGQPLKSQAEKQNVQIEKDLASLVLHSDLIFSVVTGDVALRVAEESLPFIAGKTYVDMNTVSPKTKIRMCELIQANGGRFIEVAILGTIASYGFKSPMLFCGEGAEELCDFLTAMDFHVTFFSAEIGKASAMKMLRSVFAKGVECLLIEMLLGAKKSNLLQQVMDAVVSHMDQSSFLEIANTWVTTNVVHAKRRAEEMEHVVETLNELDIRPIMAAAARDRLRLSADLGLYDHFKGQKPGRYEEVIATMADRE